MLNDTDKSIAHEDQIMLEERSVNEGSKPQPFQSAPINVLFLHPRDYFTPDLSVHYSLMESFTPDRTRPFIVCNSQAGDVERHIKANDAIPSLTSRMLPFGKAVESEGGLNAQSLWSLVKCLLVVPSVISFAKKSRIDIIHSSDRPRDVLLATILAKLVGRPNIIHLHTNAGAYNNRVLKWGFKHATAFFVVSKFIYDEACELGLRPESLYQVPNATNGNHFNPAIYTAQKSELRNDLLSKYGLPADAFVVGIVARVNQWKGQRELIDALATLLPKYPNLFLCIIGSASDASRFSVYERELARRVDELGIASNVIFGGKFRDVRPILSALDVFALPSHAEPFGLAITEAMAMELPVIACNSGGVPEIIDSGKNGLLVEPRSAESLADAISFIFDNPESARKMGVAARKRVLDAFEPKKIAAKASEIYQKIVSSSR
jgi:glycosyltransferase involved in cell wall biosynthesis